MKRGEPSATVIVNRHQSAYLRFHLSDKSGTRARVREPGEVGIAEKRNFIPVGENLQALQGRGLTPQGNLHRSSLKKLFFRAQTMATRNKAQAERDRKRLEKLKGGGAVTDAELEAFRTEKKRRKVKRKPGGPTDIFFGVPRGRTTKRRGFWQRPKDGSGKIRPLVHAEDRSDYSNSDKIQSAWNAGVMVGADRSPDIIERAIEKAIAKAGRK